MNNSLIPLVTILSYCTVLVTLLYSLKTLIDIYYTSYKGFGDYLRKMHYSSLFMQIPLLILCTSSIYSGYFLQDAMIGINTDFLSKSLYISASNIASLESYEFVSNNSIEQPFSQ
jgi:NADH:ubiquinone oxidoreductase subunit 5 (subunit L)/multisubunit Na+/H+ antiporter MnhA subunit